MQQPFNRPKKEKLKKTICLFLALNLFFQVVSPTVGMALTAGAASPEFSSFEPVATTDMVSDFTGDFTYNIPVLNVPGPDGGGYSMSLAYHAGASSEEEASWVGYGWTLNPGAINRQKRGYPDEFKEVSVQKYNRAKPNWTQSANFDIALEIASNDQGQKSSENASKAIDKFMKLFNFSATLLDNRKDNQKNEKGQKEIASVSFSKSIRYNNYNGFSISTSYGLSANGMASLNVNNSGGETTLGYSINPLGIITKWRNHRLLKQKARAFRDFMSQKTDYETWENSRSILDKKLSNNNSASRFPIAYQITSPSTAALPYSVSYNWGRSVEYRASVHANLGIPLGIQMGYGGNMNIQANIPAYAVKANGYWNPLRYNDLADKIGSTYYDVLANNKTIREADYSLEKESTFDKHDVYLGIPHGNYDVFAASGNGVMGGFRLHHKRAGQYYPNFLDNVVQFRKIAFELGIGSPLEVGTDFGFGRQTTSVQDWHNGILLSNTSLNRDNIEFYPAGSGVTNASFFQFMNDPGGELVYGNQDNNNPLYAKVNDGLNFFSRKLNADPLFNGVDYSGEYDLSKNGQTSKIDYAYYDNSGTLMNALDKEITRIPSSFSSTDRSGMLAQFMVKDAKGQNNVYGLPVYTYNEKELSFSITNSSGDFETDDGQNKAVVYTAGINLKDPITNKKAVIGQTCNKPYATSFLLTSTRGHDYVDVNGNNEPDEEDFGAWTKFRYHKTHSAYRYRSPYNGLNYNRGRLCDLKDQTGSVSTGLKEVYYLNNIETKSHIAFFVTNKTGGTTTEITTVANTITNTTDKAKFIALVTGSQTTRYDGVDAAGTDQYGKDLAAASAIAKGSNQLERLEKIVLFSKTDLTTPISVTYFDYDYSLCQGIPNTLGTTAATQGKLTLKKVWTEGGGALKSRISPYQFQYNYFTGYTQAIKNKYPDIAAFASQVGAPAFNQNPAYDKNLLDAWGSYQENGKDREIKMQSWVDQKAASASFDPAAWQLKRIILPSGGEIHVHYEQKDYRYVQDQNAMVLTALASSNQGDLNGYEAKDNKYYIDLSSVGPGLNAASLTAYKDYLRKYYITDKNKLYYKMLYAYRGNPTNLMNNTDLDNSDYIEGYTTVNNVDIENNQIYLELGENAGKEDKTLPRYQGYVRHLTAAHLNMGPGQNAWEDFDTYVFNAIYGNVNNHTSQQGFIDVLSNVTGHTIGKTGDLFSSWTNSNGEIRNPKRKESCKEFNPNLSYFKLPVYGVKKGGGIRVKRILSYNPGIATELKTAGENQDATLFGTEYLYQSADGGSSGIATNEPVFIREESALVKFLERKKQSGMDKLLRGRDAKTFEGPLGETLLPGPTVVHERVVMKNIHTGVTSTGYAVNQYYTVKDFPSVNVDYTSLSKDNDTYRKFKLGLPIGMISLDFQKAWATQGYLFKLNDMHGKPKAQATYAGNYINPASMSSAVSSTEYLYSSPGEAFNALSYTEGVGFTQENLNLGQEADLSMYMSSVKEKNLNGRIEIDLDIYFATPAVSLGIGFGLSYSDALFSQHVTSKIISQRSYLKKTITTTDGVKQITENLAFNKQNGEPVLTRTYDGFMGDNYQVYTNNDNNTKHDGYYYALNFPASWVYPELGPVYNNSNYQNRLDLSAGSVVSYGKNPVTTNGTSASPFQNVVSSNVITFAKNQFSNGTASYEQLKKDYTDFVSPDQNHQNALNKLNSFYFPQRSYVYRETQAAQMTDANNGKRIYNGGYVNSMVMYKWAAGATNDSKWFSPGYVSIYSPNGYPLEEKDVLGIYSSAKFGYNNQLPVAVAKNAPYNSLEFYDFERTGTQFTNISNASAHTGTGSFDLANYPNQTFLSQKTITNEMKTQGISVKLWLKSQLSANSTSANYNKRNPNPQLAAVITGISNQPFTYIAQTGEWSLYELRLSPAQVNSIPGTTLNLSLSYNKQAGEVVYIDDFRMQPLDAEISCSVYYKNYKVAAQFDSQHFATFYEYNNEGGLVRISKETERGRKTIKEQQYNTPGLPR